MENQMTVGELRKAIADLPDDMVIVTYDHGRMDDEFTGAEVIEGGDRYPDGEKGRKYFLIY